MALHETIELPKREPIRDKDFLMPFGKYKDISIGDLIYAKPGYLLWLHNNTDFELHADLLDEVEKAMTTWK